MDDHVQPWSDPVYSVSCRGRATNGGTMRRKLLVATTLIVGTIGVGGASAETRDATTDQYGGAPLVGQSTTPTTATTPATPTTPTTAVEPSSAGGSTPSDNSTDTSTSTPGGGGGTSPAQSNGTATPKGGTSAGSGAGAGKAATPKVAILNFAKPSKDLKADILAAIAQTGYVPAPVTVTKDRFVAFAASPLLKLLATSGTPLAAGQAFGAQLVNVTPLAAQAFPALVGPSAPFDQVTGAVLDRRAHLAPGQAKFLDGIAKGFKAAGIPFAYVERADVKKSFVDHFKALDVLTVKDIDTATGQSRLAKILLRQITTQQAVDAVSVTPASSPVTANAPGSAGTAPWLLLAVVLGGVGFTASGVLRHRGRRAGRASV